MQKGKLFSIIGLVILVLMITFSPFESDKGDFSQILDVWGGQQTKQSEELTNKLLEDVEGGVVGEHKVDGSNWSIPNIIRHLLGVEE